MEHFVKRLDKAYAAIDDADYILVGAGAAALGFYGYKAYKEIMDDFPLNKKVEGRGVFTNKFTNFVHSKTHF